MDLKLQPVLPTSYLRVIYDLVISTGASELASQSKADLGLGVGTEEPMSAVLNL